MVLITGASRGLGKELFQSYTAKGTPVMGTYNSTQAETKNPQLSQVNVVDYASVQEWIQRVCAGHKGPLTLINCAGISYNSFLHKSDPDAWAQVIQVNLIGTYNCIRAALPIMRENNHGRIICFSSVVAQMGIPGTSSYAASKAGLWGLTKSLSKEFKGKDITVNTINLGYFNAGMIEQVPESLQQDIKTKIPKERFGEPSELFNLVEYIQAAPYINGSSFDINGGLF